MHFYGSNDPTNSVKALKEDRVLRIRLQSQQVHSTVLTIIQQLCSMKQKHIKYTQIYGNKSMHSETGTKPNPKNCKNCSSKCAYDCAQLQYTLHNTTQNSSDNLPSYLQTTMIAQMLSIGGDGKQGLQN